MAEPLKPPFTYFGGKIKLAERIVALFPQHEHYVEPFAGSLSVLLAKPPSHMETVNDLDGDLVTFWRILRERPADLERACFLTPHSRAEHKASFKSAEDDLERARRVWVRLTQGRGGHTSRRTGWHYNQNPAGHSVSIPGFLDAYVKRMPSTVLRLRGVSLECRSAADVIRDYGRHPRVLIYADPPYLGSVRASHDGYATEMLSEEEHRDLLWSLLGCRAAVVLSGYASPLYDDLLCTWSRREIATQTGNGGSDRARVEVLWSNRPFAQGSLFDLEAS